MVKDRVCSVNEDQLLDWAGSLSDDEASFLLSVVSTEHETTLNQAAAQDSRIIAIFGWSLVGIGTLALTETIGFALDLQGIASMAAIASAILVLVGGTYALWPRDLATGVGASWFADFVNPRRVEMQSFVLVSLLVANRINDQLLGRRSLALKWMITSLVVEVVLVILTAVAAAI